MSSLLDTGELVFLPALSSQLCRKSRRWDLFNLAVIVLGELFDKREAAEFARPRVSG